MEHLDLSKSNLTTLGEEVLEKCKSLHSLDISKNKLKDLSCMKNSTLKVLNFEDNSVKDLTFLSSLTSLESLYLNGNPLNAADRYIAVDLVPSLVTLDGRSCKDIRKYTDEFGGQVNHQGMILFESKYKERMARCSSTEEGNDCKKLFLRDLLNKISSSSRIPPSYMRYKVQDFIEKVTKEIFSALTKSSENNTKCDELKKKPVRSPLKCAATPTKLNRFQDATSPKRRKSCDTELQDFEYEPELILRIHSSDPNDAATPVWAAAFEPDIADERKTTDMVATCGGNFICFLNCKTGRVLMKYKGESPTENFFALSWTVLTAKDQEKMKVSVLAAGGNDKKVFLILPSSRMCYLSFKAHNLLINALYFHPQIKEWLFSGGKDKSIHLWDIGSLELTQLKSKQKKLMTFDASSEVLRLLFTPYNKCLFAATHNGLKVWNLAKEMSVWTRYPSVDLILPETCKAEKSELVDGLVLVSENVMAVKISQSWKMFLWDFSSMLRVGKRKEFQIVPSVVLVWDECNTDYIYTDSCIDAGLLACGDDKGRLWFYDMKKYSTVKSSQLVSTLNQLPTVVFPWPKLTFDKETLPTRKQVIINSVSFNWNGEYLLSCTDNNLVAIWKRF